MRVNCHVERSRNISRASVSWVVFPAPPLGCPRAGVDPATRSFPSGTFGDIQGHSTPATPAPVRAGPQRRPAVTDQRTRPCRDRERGACHSLRHSREDGNRFGVRRVPQRNHLSEHQGPAQRSLLSGLADTGLVRGLQATPSWTYWTNQPVPPYDPQRPSSHEARMQSRLESHGDGSGDTCLRSRVGAQSHPRVACARS